MGALPQLRPDVPGLRKPPTSERKLDRYGRDPNSAPERLRAHTDYEKETGYCPLWDAMQADLHRLRSGEVYYALILQVHRLSFGRPHGKGTPRHRWTEPISAAELAELAYVNVRDIQRKLVELEARGMIAVKQSRGAGTVKYSVSLLVEKWRAVEDYGVWKARQVVAIDEASAELVEDEAAPAISKDAVRLCKKPQRIGPGRASRAVPVNCGVKSFQVVNGSGVDVIYDPVIQSGCLTFSLEIPQGEQQAKEISNSTPVTERSPQVIDSKQSAKSVEFFNPQSGAGIAAIFNPLLKLSGSLQTMALDPLMPKACAEVGRMPLDFLEAFITGNKARCKRVYTPAAVVAIIREARQNWEARQSPRAEYLEILAHPRSYSQDEVRAARRMAELEGA